MFSFGETSYLVAVPSFMSSKEAGNSYCNKIFLLCERLVRGVMRPQFLLMKDNTPYHCTVAVGELLEREDIKCTDWMAKSRFLNPIEHVFSKKTFGSMRFIVSNDFGAFLLQNEWVSVPLWLIDNLILIVAR